MVKALKDAEVVPTDIDYYNAHGTSTHLNDLTETQMLKIALGEHAYKIKVSSTMSMTGHCVGAAGVIEAMISTLAIRDSFYPATINLDNPDAECDLDYVPRALKATLTLPCLPRSASVATMVLWSSRSLSRRL